MPHERPAFPSRPLSPLLGTFFPYTNVKGTNGRISLDFSVFSVTSVVKPFCADGGKLQRGSTERILERVRKRNPIAGTARPGGNRDELWALRSRWPESPIRAGDVTLAVPASAPADGSCPANADACAGAGRAAAERCEEGSCSCCKGLLRRRKPAASGREPHTPD